jgi:hypothetical protein
MVSRAAAGRAAELEQARGDAREEEREVKLEESMLKKWKSIFKKKYGSKTPAQLFSEGITKDRVKAIQSFYAWAAGRIAELINKDYTKEKELRRYFDAHKREFGENYMLEAYVAIQQMKKKQNEIIATFQKAQQYWTLALAKMGTLGWMHPFLKKYDDEPLDIFLAVVEEKELQVLVNLDKVDHYLKPRLM